MNETNNQIIQLESEIADTMTALKKMESFYGNLKDTLSDNNDPRNAITLSEIFVNYYTCLETIFFRISTFFENNLPKDRWHAELLLKMKLSINGIRQAVISDQTYHILDEFRRFRHFKRYYFQFLYDWDKLDFLQKKFEQLLDSIHEEFGLFLNFFVSVKNSSVI